MRHRRAPDRGVPRDGARRRPMNIHGTPDLGGAPRGAVFAAILDPDVLLAVIPGCQEIEQVSPTTEYRGTDPPAAAGHGRRVPDRVVRVVEAEAPGSGRLEGEVTGALGSIDGRARRSA